MPEYLPWKEIFNERHSSLGIIEIQDSLSKISDGSFYLTNPITVLANAIHPIREDYDYILVDCPPNLGIITLNGLYVSDFYLIPTIPDILSTYGIPQIISRIDSFARHGNLEIKPAGIVISMYRAQSRTHKSVKEMLHSKAQAGHYPAIYETVIPLTKDVADAADFNATPSTLKQKYGYSGMFSIYDKLANEFLEKTE